MASYHVGDVIAAINGNRAYFGNPNIGGNLVEPYVYLNFFGTGGTTFDQVVFHNQVNFRGFESDSHSVRVAPVTDPPGSVIGELPEVPEPASRALAVVGLVFLGIVSSARRPFRTEVTRWACSVISWTESCRNARDREQRCPPARRALVPPGGFRAESPGSLWCTCGHDLQQHGEAYRDSMRREHGP